jgi:xanthine dehydrogenase accessory factor
MRDWLQALHAMLAENARPVVRVVVSTVRGSAPREAGASMLVTTGRETGTIGGGHLELVATRIARDMLKPGAAGIRADRFPLAASLGQCCGGIVELWFERYEAPDLVRVAEALRLRDQGASNEAIAAFASRDPRAASYERFHVDLTPLWLFGAGHVGRALVEVLAPLPFAVTWIDSREGFATIHAAVPADEVGDMPAGAWALVMTHSHDEDLAICEALLAHGRFAWAGVIGSAAKTKRFRQRLSRRFAPEAVARLTMPIGIGGIASKEPAAIAVSVAAQLLQLREARAALATPSRQEATGP